ncbi:hypothetical protein EJ05DRAFT_514294 [Pseudovirgaria hyperparasitica]|uniref:C2H2-type domain-containing protein n=1 Tax=Pseudovirgaria hyperparasitica TaxID=470096 RepID=A0A6A6VVV4_9PEZI|nr:uncharacterized protein EJ05DRAFT_514294 [Pseudovirgaria hyperparasitica]KAF2754295.1 hypothetical protein EJ05DRAFT_514294 [Pseudovirgaria hyperparasitica]
MSPSPIQTTTHPKAPPTPPQTPSHSPSPPPHHRPPPKPSHPTDHCFPCTLCPKAFTSLAAQRNHQHSCGYNFCCGKRFKTAKRLLQHAETHSFTCATCGSGFGTRYFLMLHLSEWRAHVVGEGLVQAVQAESEESGGSVGRKEERTEESKESIGRKQERRTTPYLTLEILEYERLHRATEGRGMQCAYCMTQFCENDDIITHVRVCAQAQWAKTASLSNGVEAFIAHPTFSTNDQAFSEHWDARQWTCQIPCEFSRTETAGSTCYLVRVNPIPGYAPEEESS